MLIVIACIMLLLMLLVGCWAFGAHLNAKQKRWTHSSDRTGQIMQNIP